MRFTRDPGWVYRSARTLVFVNATTSLVMTTLVLVSFWRGQASARYMGALLTAMFWAMTLVAWWRMRRARRERKTIDLFAPQ